MAQGALGGEVRKFLEQWSLCVVNGLWWIFVFFSEKEHCLLLGLILTRIPHSDKRGEVSLTSAMYDVLTRTIPCFDQAAMDHGLCLPPCNIDGHSSPTQCVYILDTPNCEPLPHPPPHVPKYFPPLWDAHNTHRPPYFLSQGRRGVKGVERQPQSIHLEVWHANAHDLSFNYVSTASEIKRIYWSVGTIWGSSGTYMCACVSVCVCVGVSV